MSGKKDMNLTILQTNLDPANHIKQRARRWNRENPIKSNKFNSSKRYHPENEFKFPETMFGNQKRSCQHKWLKKIAMVRL